MTGAERTGRGEGGNLPHPTVVVCCPSHSPCAYRRLCQWLYIKASISGPRANARTSRLSVSLLLLDTTAGELMQICWSWSHWWLTCKSVQPMPTLDGGTARTQTTPKNSRTTAARAHAIWMKQRRDGEIRCRLERNSQRRVLACEFSAQSCFCHLPSSKTFSCCVHVPSQMLLAQIRRSMSTGASLFGHAAVLETVTLVPGTSCSPTGGPPRRLRLRRNVEPRPADVSLGSKRRCHVELCSCGGPSVVPAHCVGVVGTVGG